MGRRCDETFLEYVRARLVRPLTSDESSKLAWDLHDAEVELTLAKRDVAALRSELAKWKPEGPCAKENRVAIDVLLEAAAALSHLRPSTLDIDERPRFAAPLYTAWGLAMHVRTGKYLAINMEVPGWVGREPKTGPLPKPPCRCGLTQGHEPTCPELDR